VSVSVCLALGSAMLGDQMNSGFPLTAED